MRIVTYCTALAAVGCGDGTSVKRDAGGAVAIDAPDIDAPPDAPQLGYLDGTCTGQPGRPRVLVYTYENQWRHVSNVYAREALLDMCETRGFNVAASNDPHIINAIQLSQFDVVVFSVTSGSAIDVAGKAAFEAWVQAGGGVVGFEAATATEQQWPFYVQNMGAEFLTHPPELEPGTVRLAPISHPITDELPASLDLVEQWYVFKARPENVPGLTVLMTLDESTLPATHPADQMVGYRAYAWVHEKFGGRVFYTALGDNPEIFSNATLLEMFGRGIEWVAHQR